MWLIDVCGGYAAIVGLGVQCRWETGLGSGLGLGVGVRKRTGRKVEKKKRRKKTKKIQQKENMFLFDSK